MDAHMRQRESDQASPKHHMPLDKCEHSQMAHINLLEWSKLGLLGAHKLMVDLVLIVVLELGINDIAGSTVIRRTSAPQSVTPPDPVTVITTVILLLMIITVANQAMITFII